MNPEKPIDNIPEYNHQVSKDDIHGIFRWFSINEYFIRDVDHIIKSYKNNPLSMDDLYLRYTIRLTSTKYTNHFHGLLSVIDFIRDTKNTQFIQELIKNSKKSIQLIKLQNELNANSSQYVFNPGDPLRILESQSNTGSIEPINHTLNRLEAQIQQIRANINSLKYTYNQNQSYLGDFTDVIKTINGGTTDREVYKQQIGELKRGLIPIKTEINEMRKSGKHDTDVLTELHRLNTLIAEVARIDLY